MEKKIIIPKRTFFNNKNYTLDYKNKTLIVDPKILKSMQEKKPGTFGGFKKMTGSALGAIMGLSSFDSQFEAFCNICGFRKPILNRKYVDAGIALEPKIVKIIEKKLNSKLLRYEANQYNYDYFKDNELFGGLPDGYSPERHLIIEIKTVGEKNYENWIKYGVNPGYIKQAQLYTYLIGATSFSIVACFLKEEDYLNPNNVDITKRIIKNWTYILNNEQVQDDINYCMQWYKKYTQIGISPKWNEQIDQDLLKFLECNNQEEWKNLYLYWVDQGKAVLEYEQA
ncbi:MAGa7180 family putative nuclease [Metamycoplasma hominis]|uniref:MAGa7180 family putative nuclease n=1 Tax=Metamycoplasma hominis TaxID=2098 RepID=UPI0013140AF4|nr:hypothetical protein [Metamycoplasma hominis]